MRVSLGWLAEWIDLPSDPEVLAERLTMGGLEIDAIERRGSDLSGIIVGSVLERAAHPGADRLAVCQVDVGTGGPVPIVCGAPNVAAGQKVAVACPGAKLPDGTVDTLLQPENQEQLQTVLTYHVVPGNMNREALWEETMENDGAVAFKTVQGEYLTVSRNGNNLMVMDAQGNSANITVVDDGRKVFIR